MIPYLKRALRRLIAKGPRDTLAYSFHVARNHALSGYIDLRYGRKVSRTRPLKHLGLPDPTAIHHSTYYVLSEIFRLEPVSPADVLVDVGCGDGRVINYWLYCGLRNRIVGIEIDPATAHSTAKRLARYSNVEIICGDASGVDLDGTVFYLFNPFGGRMLADFERRRRGRPGKIIIYNYNDLTPFIGDHWQLRYHTSTRDDRQYRVVVLLPQSSPGATS